MQDTAGAQWPLLLIQAVVSSAAPDKQKTKRPVKDAWSLCDGCVTLPHIMELQSSVQVEPPVDCRAQLAYAGRGALHRVCSWTSSEPVLTQSRGGSLLPGRENS